MINVSTFKNVDEEDVLKVSEWLLARGCDDSFFFSVNFCMFCSPPSSHYTASTSLNLLGFGGGQLLFQQYNQINISVTAVFTRVLLFLCMWL